MVGRLERIGEGKEAPGYLLLQLLSQQGWAVDVVADPAGVLVTASKLGQRTVSRRGRSVAEVAVDVVEEATRGAAA
jgi:hypothetical protein